MNSTTTTELAAAFQQEQRLLIRNQNLVLEAGLTFDVSSAIFSQLLSKKMHSEDQYLASVQRKEILKNKILMQRSRLTELNRSYDRFRELFQAWQATLKKMKS
jgi:hypothetical protein